MNSAIRTAGHRSTDSVDRVVLEPSVVLGLRERVAPSEIKAFFARALPAVAGELARAGIHAAGAPIAVYRHEADQHFDVTVGFPVDQASATPVTLVREQLPGGPAARAVHEGSYDALPAAYHALSQWFAERHLAPPTMMWEQYLVGPGDAPQNRYLTQIVYPVAR